jgi:hypothetical protein
MPALRCLPFPRTFISPALLAVAALLGSLLLQAEAQAVTRPSSAAVHARRAQGTSPDKIPRGAGAGSDNSSQNMMPTGGGATVESNKSYILEYGIVVVLAGAALGAICKSSNRV